jgi:hypothetical protein
MLVWCVAWSLFSIFFYKLWNRWLLVEAFRFWAENALDVGIGDLQPKDNASFYTILCMWVGYYFAGVWLTDFLVDAFSMSPHRSAATQDKFMWRCSLVLFLWLLLGQLFFMAHMDQSFVDALFSSSSLVLTNGTGIPPLLTMWENMFVGIYIVVGVPLVNFVAMVYFFHRSKRVRAIWTEKDFGKETCLPWGLFLERALVKADVVDPAWLANARKEFNALDRNKDERFCRDELGLLKPVTKWYRNPMMTKKRGK